MENYFADAFALAKVVHYSVSQSCSGMKVDRHFDAGCIC
jgi:hypothetical protein